VAAGSHELRISAEGKKDYRQKITVLAGQGVRIDAPLADLPGTVVVQTSPGAAVFLDGSSRGMTDAKGQLAIPEVAAGSHELRVTAPGKKEYQHSFYVAGGLQAGIEVRLEDAGPPPPGTVRENPKDGLRYVWIPAGSFLMGCSPGDGECAGDEKPPHTVTLTKGFWLGQTEVTVGAYKRFTAATGRPMPPAPAFNSAWANDLMPIVTVTWDEALDYCMWAGGRLPTEAEWEYAARGGSSAARYGPIDHVAWYDANSGGQTHPVGEKAANGLELFDVLGNTLEWVNDWYGEKYYRSDPVQDPAGPAHGTKRVFRGGNFLLKSKAVRVSNRDGGVPGDRFRGTGIRCGGEVLAP
jgi:formylglycine-generating enzyme required for sulfatase activity